MSASTLFLGVMFSAAGLGYFVYGKKQRAIVPLLCGIGLMALPCFVTGAWLLVALGAIIAAVPYYIRI